MPFSKKNVNRFVRKPIFTKQNFGEVWLSRLRWRGFYQHLNSNAINYRITKPFPGTPFIRKS